MEKTTFTLWKRLEILYVTKSLANRLIMLILCSLPPSYKSFRETLIYGRDNLSFEDVKGHLLSKDKLDNEFGSNRKLDRKVSILVASRKRDKICRYCKKLGHIEAYCYK
ncbi:hypothetical protein Gotur_033084, partial [Gossypium turneri]